MGSRSRLLRLLHSVLLQTVFQNPKAKKNHLSGFGNGHRQGPPVEGRMDITSYKKKTRPEQMVLNMNHAIFDGYLTLTMKTNSWILMATYFQTTPYPYI